MVAFLKRLCVFLWIALIWLGDAIGTVAVVAMAIFLYLLAGLDLAGCFAIGVRLFQWAPEAVAYVLFVLIVLLGPASFIWAFFRLRTYIQGRDDTPSA